MKKKEVLKIGIFTSIFGSLFGSIIPHNSFAGPRAFGPKAPSFERNTDQSKSDKFDPLQKNSEKMSLERLQRSQDEGQILSALKINREEMKSLVREFKGNAEEFVAFQNLLGAARSSSSKEDRALLKNYFQLLAKTSGDFHLSPTRLKEQLYGWSPFAKLQFARVLEAAIEISSDGRSVLREDAFEQALKKFDLDRDYRKQCRK